MRAIGGMYQVKNPMETAMQGMANAANSYSKMDKGGKTETEVAKTAGGAIASGAGGAAAGASIGSSITQGASVGGWWGAGIGAAVGILGYLLG
jgi:hypothetical protein